MRSVLLFLLFFPSLLFGEEGSVQEEGEGDYSREHAEEVLEAIWNEGVLENNLVEPTRSVRQNSGDFRSERLVWSPDNTSYSAQTEYVVLEFVSGDGEKRFHVTVRFERRGLVAVHSKPYASSLAGGIRVYTAGNLHSWGGYLHSKDTSGALVLVPKGSKKPYRAVAVCPREVGSRKKLAPLLESDYRLSAIGAGVSFTGEAGFLTARGEGEVEVKVVPEASVQATPIRFARLPEGEESAYTWSKQGANPQLSFSLAPAAASAHEELAPVAIDTKLQAARVRAKILLRNSAGYEKVESVEVNQWFQRIQTTEDSQILLVGKRQSSGRLSLQRGECVLSYLTVAVTPSFSEPDEPEEGQEVG